MAFDPYSAGILALTGYKSYQERKAGEEVKSLYDTYAAEEIRQAGVAERIGQERQRELIEAEGEQIGAAKAAVAGKGLRVAGSASTLTANIQRKIARRKALIGFETSEQMRGHYFQAGQYAKRGRAEARAGKQASYYSLLAGGLTVGKHLWQKGKTPEDYKGWLFKANV